jgi:hypothetical protein
MKGDTSRGHEPDRKRGRRYRRVLLQQGRLLLDSDVNALVDAHDALLRGVASDLGCPAGSPDLGYLITPGRLLALFDEIGHVEAGAGIDVYRDYRYKFAGRYPALYIGNPTAAAGSVTIRLRHEPAGDVDFWVRSDGTSTMHIPGAADVVASSPDFVAHTRPLAPARDLQLTLDAGEEIWIGLIEGHQAAGTLPRLWAAAGRFHVAGLTVENPGDGAYPDVSFDPALGFSVADLLVNVPAGPRPLQAGDRIAAFLEAWERHITAVEDRGIREEALGGTVDTCTRTQAVGQVKLVAGHDLSAEELRSAIRRPADVDGRLDVTTLPAAHDPAPCALPVSGGYTGTENRLYRFEVHAGGALADTVLKWSRDNASGLFAAAEATDTELTFPRDTPLRDGDLVEVLSDAIDLGDRAAASIDPAARQFMPPERAVGVLGRLRGVAPVAGATGKTFELRDPHDDDVPVPALSGHFGAPLPALKVRRWHGLIEPDGTDPFEPEIEDGIKLSLTGTFRTGDWWQHEARVRRDNDNGPFRTAPHGPERLFAPLALLEYQGPGAPLRLVEWLDERFGPLCELTADDIAFDGSRMGEESDTVQEVIEKLLEKHDSGCCEYMLVPRNGGDDGVSVADVLADTTGDVVICLRPGIYRFEAAVEIAGRRVTVRGCPDALIVAPGAEPAFRLREGGRLVLEDLTLFAGAGAGTERLVEIDATARGLEARAVGFLMARPGADQVAVRIANVGPTPADPDAPGGSMGSPGGSPRAAPEVALRECVVHSGWIVSAQATGMLTLRDCACYCSQGGITARWVLGTDVSDTTIVTGVDPAVSGAWTAARLREEESAVLEALADAGPVNPGNVALGAALLGPGNVERCTFVARLGVAAHRIDRVRFHGNRYAVRMTGLSCEQAESVRIDGEVMAVGADEPRVGIHIARQGERVRITNCDVTGAATGVLLAGDLVPTDVSASVPRTFRGVSVAGNRLGAREEGIRIAAGFGLPFRGEVEDLAIHANHVIADRIGIYVHGHPTETAHARVRVAENLVLATTAVTVAGPPRFEVEGNRLRVERRQEGFNTMGIFAHRTSHLVVENNLIECDTPVDSTAIDIEEGNDARLTGNVIDQPFEGVGLRVSSHTRPQVINNSFGNASCVVSGGTGLVFRANELGRLVGSDVASGSVNDNHFREFVDLERIEGNWQVMDNDVASALEIRPRTTGKRLRFPFGDLVFTSDIHGKYRIALDVIGALADVVVRPPGPPPVLGGGRLGGGAGRPGVGGVGPSRGPEPRAPEGRPAVPRERHAASIVAPGTPSEATAVVIENPNWAGDWEAVIVADVTSRFGDVLVGGSNVPDVVVAPLERREVAYHVQVIGNWVHEGKLNVGTTTNGLPVFADPHPDSIVQIVSNRMGGALTVNQYHQSRAVVIAFNVAHGMTGWIISGLGHVNIGNLNL